MAPQPWHGFFQIANNPASGALLDRIAGAGAVVPGLWRLETANILLVAERRGRVTAIARQKALPVLADLPIQVV